MDPDAGREKPKALLVDDAAELLTSVHASLDRLHRQAEKIMLSEWTRAAAGVAGGAPGEASDPRPTTPRS